MFSDVLFYSRLPQPYTGGKTRVNSSPSASSTPTPTAGRAMHVRAMLHFHFWRKFTFVAFSVTCIVLAFSGGARGCIGQRFAVTESICILASLVRRYEIRIPDDLRSKSFEDQRRLMLHWFPMITNTPTNARVRLDLRV